MPHDRDLATVRDLNDLRFDVAGDVEELRREVRRLWEKCEYLKTELDAVREAVDQ
jgi:hypothetical protein